ncbi:MAG: hypothetical protein ABJD07_00595 [Gemmatimonadaceae bacterium]
METTPPLRDVLDSLELGIVLDALPDAIAIVDREWRLLFLNPRGRANFAAIGACTIDRIHRTPLSRSPIL